MPLFILAETPAGYALLKSKDKKILQRDDLEEVTTSAERVCELLKLKTFDKFDSAQSAVEEATALIDGKITSKLSNLLNTIKDEKKASLAVADPKLAKAVNELGLPIEPLFDSSTAELYRGIREHLPSLLPGLMPDQMAGIRLGMAHSLSRHKLKFSTAKFDTMIVQAIGLLDELDKELNTYAMRVKEWYGWHFPEMGRIVNDNLAYARVILKVGMRSNASSSDLAEILPEEIETAVKAAAEVSMGTEITDDDLENIKALAEQVVGFTEYRQELSSYLSARMQAIAPNTTALLGELVGARMIAHAGSLMNLAKAPASTIQILGAEKALFRALKTKHDTPKYGLIYHASLVGQATGKNKGKIARVLAAKSAIGSRIDALADWGAETEGDADAVPEEEKSAMGVAWRSQIERRLAAMEGKPLKAKGVAIAPDGQPAQPGKWAINEARKYNKDVDGLAGDEPAAAAHKEKKSKKPKIEVIEQSRDSDDESDSDEEEEDSEEEEEREIALEEAIKPLSNGKIPNGKSAKKALSDDESDSDSPSPQKVQSSILGSSKEAKKARKKEREARKSDGESEEAKFLRWSKETGLPVERVKRKHARGELTFDENGVASSISKKDIKKQKKAEEKAALNKSADTDDSGKKRKRKSEGGEKEDKDKKKKKKSKA